MRKHTTRQRRQVRAAGGESACRRALLIACVAAALALAATPSIAEAEEADTATAEAMPLARSSTMPEHAAVLAVVLGLFSLGAFCMAMATKGA